MSDMAIGLLMDTLTDVTRCVLTIIDVDVLWDVNGNVFIIVMTAFEFVMPGP